MIIDAAADRGVTADALVTADGRIPDATAPADAPMGDATCVPGAD